MSGNQEFAFWLRLVFCNLGRSVKFWRISFSSSPGKRDSDSLALSQEIKAEIKAGLRFQFFKFPTVQGPNPMFHLYLSRTVTMFGVFAMVSLVSGVTYGQSGSTSFGGSATRAPAPAFGGGSGTTQFGGSAFGGGSSTTQFGGGSFGGGSSTTQFGGGSSTTGSFQNQSFSPNQSFAPAQDCSSCGQAEPPAAPAFDCSNCGLPPAPAFNNCGWNYPQLQPGSRAIFPRRPRGGQGNCCN